LGGSGEQSPPQRAKTKKGGDYNEMREMWSAFEIYQGFIAKSGFVEMFRRQVWEITLGCARTATMRAVMFYIGKAEKAVKKTEAEAQK